LSEPLGNAYSEFGSSDQTLEGFFDLGGLPTPHAASSAQYELSVEALDPFWSAGVCPYDPSQVASSGIFPTLLVPVGAGGDIAQDILMSGSAQPVLQDVMEIFPSSTSGDTSPAINNLWHESVPASKGAPGRVRADDW
jgi:hypothetical protein